MQNNKIIQVTFISTEVTTTITMRLADIGITLATSREGMQTDLIHEHLQHIPDQQCFPQYS